MNLFPVYSRLNVEPVRGEGAYLYDVQGNKYLDFYGGHAVISIGHSHPHYVKRIQSQINNLGYYSNAVKNSFQKQLAEKLGAESGLEEYSLFLCNSGAEANENALKLASFHTGCTKIIAFHGGFHGRTSAAVSVTDNAKIQAPINRRTDVDWLPLNDYETLETAIDSDVCAVIIEGIQGIGGIRIAEDKFLHKIRSLCDEHGVMLILDEVQAGYGRTGDFFSFQQSGIKPDLISIAKGMGNGFPIAGILIHPEFQAEPGMLGSTFGGNHLACAAGLAVLEVISTDDLISNAKVTGEYLLQHLAKIGTGVRAIRGRGLMIGIELNFPYKKLRETLLYDYHIFTGSSKDGYTLRLLPPLSIGKTEADQFLNDFQTVVESYG